MSGQSAVTSHTQFLNWWKSAISAMIHVSSPLKCFKWFIGSSKQNHKFENNLFIKNQKSKHKIQCISHIIASMIFLFTFQSMIHFQAWLDFLRTTSSYSNYTWKFSHQRIISKFYLCYVQLILNQILHVCFNLFDHTLE